MRELTYNDVFYTGALIEYIGRKTKNHRSDIVRIIGRKDIAELLDISDVNHCLSFEQVSDEVVQQYHVKQGDFDTISTCKYRVPDFLDIGEVYARLICSVAKEGADIPSAFHEVFTSRIPDEISDFNSAMFYSESGYVFERFKEIRKEDFPANKDSGM